MDEANLAWRAEISRRLKAARWFAGTLRPDKKGRLKVFALSPQEMAQLPRLAQNGISANLIGDTERLDRAARPMELRAIAEALGLPHDFFEGPSPSELGEDVGPREGELRRELQAGQPSQEDRADGDARRGERRRTSGDA